jgi:hypothetical protein
VNSIADIYWGGARSFPLLNDGICLTGSIGAGGGGSKAGECYASTNSNSSSSSTGGCCWTFDEEPKSKEDNYWGSDGTNVCGIGICIGKEPLLSVMDC